MFWFSFSTSASVEPFGGGNAPSWSRSGSGSAGYCSGMGGLHFGWLRRSLHGRRNPVVNSRRHQIAVGGGFVFKVRPANPAAHIDCYRRIVNQEVLGCPPPPRLITKRMRDGNGSRRRRPIVRLGERPN